MQHPIRQGDIPGVQLRLDKRFELPAERLWPWLTDPERMSRWLAARVERHADEEGWMLRGTDESGQPLIEEARRVVVDDGPGGGGKRWTATFERQNDGWQSATRLSLTISGDRSSDLSVLQEGFERLSLSSCLTVWEFYRRRWRLAFNRLEAAVSRAEE